MSTPNQKSYTKHAAHYEEMAKSEGVFNSTPGQSRLQALTTWL
jgi:hypothetical protein